MKTAAATGLLVATWVTVMSSDSVEAKLRPVGASSKVVAASPSFAEAVLGDEKHLGRVLEDGVCLCDEPEKVTTIRMLTPGGKGTSFDFFTDRWRRRVDPYFEKTGIKVELINLGSLGALDAEMMEDAGKAVYDGYGYIPAEQGALAEAGGLADLTDFVAGNEDVAWTDVLPFARDTLAVYGGKVVTLPCDGDVHSLHYRKDLFEEHGLSPPRTWDEYTEIAKYFHGMEVDNGYGNGTVTLSGSCVARGRNCERVSNLMTMQVHAGKLYSIVSLRVSSPRSQQPFRPGELRQASSLTP